MSFVRLLVSFSGFVLALPVAAASGLLFYLAQTVAGRLAAGGGIALALAVFTIAIAPMAAFRRRRRFLFQLASVYLIAAVLLGAVCYRMSPASGSVAGNHFRSEWIGHPSPPRWALSNLVPEVDQTRIATWLSPYLDDRLTAEKAEELSAVLARIYHSMQSVPEFVNSNGALSAAYREIAVGNINTGHLFAYIPSETYGYEWIGPAEAPRPVLLFFHDSPGNLKASMWIWKRVADHTGLAVIAPTCGAGSWDGDEGQAAIKLALDYCRSHPGLDAEQLSLAGVGSGSNALVRSLVANADSVKNVIFISAPVGTSLLEDEEFRAAIDRKKVFFIHDVDDLTASMLEADELSAALLEAGTPSEFLQFQTYGHFVFWTRWEDIAEVLSDWLRAS